MGKTAKYLQKFGHEIRVLSARNQPLQKALALEIEYNLVTYASWWNVNRPVELALGGRQKIASRGYSTPGPFGRALQRLGAVYKSLLNFPDGQAGWIPFGVRAGSRLIREWRPDVIFGSAMPVSSLLVARALSSRHNIPWIAELRDLWVDSPYYGQPRWRRMFEEELERTVLSSAMGFITVSEPMAEVLRAKYSKPSAVILNGFDPGDYPLRSVGLDKSGLIRIVYTGMLYDGKRDPSPLFEGLRLLGPLANRVRISFYGRYLDIARALAREKRVDHLVEIQDAVPYKEALRIQRDADVLLLLLWNDPQERMVCPGKVFEYIGARRPILVIGPSDNVAVELIVNRGAGTVSTDPAQIASLLQMWIAQKQQAGRIADTHEGAISGLSRENQTKRLESFILGILGPTD